MLFKKKKILQINFLFFYRNTKNTLKNNNYHNIKHYFSQVQIFGSTDVLDVGSIGIVEFK